MVREFVYDAQELQAGKDEITKLTTDKKKQFGPLVRWLKVNFSESFMAWIHVKVSLSARCSVTSPNILISSILKNSTKKILKFQLF